MLKDLYTSKQLVGAATKNVMPVAPEGSDELTTYKCKSGCKNNRCACRRKELLCCDGCYCEENFENRDQHAMESDQDDERLADFTI